MNSFDSDELAGMQATQESAMMDVCDLLRKYETDRQDDHGQPVFEWVIDATLACGLDMRPSRETLNAEARLYDARLRLPIGTVIDAIDRVRVHQRFGVMVDPAIEYAVIGQSHRGPSGLVLELRGIEE